jgi:hypothetical protein
MSCFGLILALQCKRIGLKSPKALASLIVMEMMAPETPIASAFSIGPNGHWAVIRLDEGETFRRLEAPGEAGANQSAPWSFHEARSPGSTIGSLSALPVLAEP